MPKMMFDENGCVCAVRGDNETYWGAALRSNGTTIFYSEKDFEELKKKVESGEVKIREDWL